MVNETLTRAGVEGMMEKKVGFMDTSVTPTVIYNGMPNENDGNYSNVWTATEDCFLYIGMKFRVYGSYGLTARIDGIEVASCGGAAQASGGNLLFATSSLIPVKKGSVLSLRNSNTQNNYYIQKINMI